MIDGCRDQGGARGREVLDDAYQLAIRRERSLHVRAVHVEAGHALVHADVRRAVRQATLGVGDEARARGVVMPCGEKVGDDLRPCGS